MYIFSPRQGLLNQRRAGGPSCSGIRRRGHPGFFEVDEEPGEGQVLLKIASCGLCNWELNFWDGNMKIGDYPITNSPVRSSSSVPASSA